MSDKAFFRDEVTGIYVGTLAEDMIETVSREKKLVCNVLIDELFDSNYSYPLTYVPLWAMSLPLRKGDKVLVQFNQNDFMYPVLYKNPSEIDSGFYEQFNLESTITGGNVKVPSSEKTVGATRIGDSSYIIKTDKYTVIHQNNSFILMTTDNKVYVYGSEINIISKGNTNIDSQGPVKIKCNSSADITATSGFTVNNHLKVNP